MRYTARTNYRTENYQLLWHVLENGLAALQVSLDDIQVELFASQHQLLMQFYGSKHLNNAFGFFWNALGLACANPLFSLVAKVLTKSPMREGGLSFLVHGGCPPASITKKRPNHGQESVHGEPKFIEGQQPYVQ